MKTYLLKLSAIGSILAREEFHKEDSLGQLQRAVNGYIERAPTLMPGEFADVDCFVDEEGLLKGVAIVNQPVTHLCNHPQITIVGDAVFATHDDEGETWGLSEEQCAALETYLISLGAIRAEDFGRIKE